MTLHRIREPVNSLTHLAGAILALAGTAALLHKAQEPMEYAAYSIYGVSLVLLFLASTALHTFSLDEAGMRRLRILDHAAIFLLIFGSYTPVTLLSLRDYSPGWGWTLFGLSAAFAFFGVVFKLFWIGAPRWLSTVLYLLMGWLVVVGIVPLVNALPAGALVLLVLGGAFYSVGAIIYWIKRPNPFPGFGFHEIWHLFVLAGSACHYAMIYIYT